MLAAAPVPSAARPPPRDTATEERIRLAGESGLQGFIQAGRTARRGRRPRADVDPELLAVGDQDVGIRGMGEVDIEVTFTADS